MSSASESVAKDGFVLSVPLLSYFGVAKLFVAFVVAFRAEFLSPGYNNKVDDGGKLLLLQPAAPVEMIVVDLQNVFAHLTRIFVSLNWCSIAVRRKEGLHRLNS